MFQSVHDCSVQCVKSLLRNKKELCSIDLELPPRDSRRLTEVGHTRDTSTRLHQEHTPVLTSHGLFQIHYVCLPRLCEDEDTSQQVSLIHVTTPWLSSSSDHSFSKLASTRFSHHSQEDSGIFSGPSTFRS